jgi:hypothetical protein
MVGKGEGALNKVKIQQTELVPIREWALPIRAKGVKLLPNCNGVSIFTWNREDALQIALQPRSFTIWALTQLQKRVEEKTHKT